MSNGVVHINSIERDKVFGRQFLHDRLLTNMRKSSWGLGSPFCSHCVEFEESTLHILRDRPLTVNVRRHLAQQEWWSELFMGDLNQWITLAEFNWDAIWGTTCSAFWRWRNKREHDPNFIAPLRPWDNITVLLRNYAEARSSAQVVLCGWRLVGHLLKKDG